MNKGYQLPVENVINYLAGLKSGEKILCKSQNHKSDKSLILCFNSNRISYSLKVKHFGVTVLKTESIEQDQIVEAVKKYNSLP